MKVFTSIAAAAVLAFGICEGQQRAEAYSACRFYDPCGEAARYFNSNSYQPNVRESLVDSDGNFRSGCITKESEYPPYGETITCSGY